MRRVQSNDKWRFYKGRHCRTDGWLENRSDRDWLNLKQRGDLQLVDSAAASNLSPNRVATATYPLVDSIESAEELLELYGRALVRDVSYEDSSAHDKYRGDLPGSAKGKFVSWFLQEPYVRGHLRVDHEYDVWPCEDYMQSMEEYLSVADGRSRPHCPIATARGAIQTPRDGATYVYRDDELEQYLGVDALLSAFNVGRNPKLLPWLQGDRNQHFWGIRHLQAMRGQLIKLVGQMTKSLKWHYLRLRPEELAAMYEGQRAGVDFGLDRTFDLVIEHERTICAMGKNNGTALLSQVYPSGCPVCPSFPSTHSMLAWANHALTCIYWNQEDLLVCGNSVREESEKLTDNLGLWRLDAGVNFRSDHYLCADIGTEIAERLVEQEVARFGSEMEFSYRRFDGSVAQFSN